MKLFYAKASPFARKCRIVAMEKGIELELVEVNAYNDPQELTSVNPLSKVPALQVSDSLSLCESPVICEYLDSLRPAPAFIPADLDQRIACLNLAALASGVTEAAISIVLEGRKPETAQIPAFIERKKALINRALPRLEVDFNPKQWMLGEIALACALSYINYRLPEFGWQQKQQKLDHWLETLAERPSFKATAPR